MHSPPHWFNSTKRNRRGVTRRRFSFLESLDLALTDPPSLCCDDDVLCPACRAESAPELVFNHR